MSLFQQAEAVFLIIIAGLLSMLIGMDRERVDNPAGLRTHILIGIGACLFTIISRIAFANNEQARIAAAS
jgi:putative Mg2+ transporter-C (MgtC) family protein